MDELSMETEKPVKKKKSKVLPLLLVVLILALCGGGYWYWDTNMNTPPPMPQVKPMAKKTAKKSAPQVQQQAKSQMPVVPEFGNLREYAQLEAEASILQKKKEVASLQMEIAKIQGEEPKKGKDKESSLSASDIQSLVSQEVGKVARETRQQRMMPAPENLPVMFISIEGVGNSISARVREFNGASLTLKPGSSFRGGKVTGISRKGITVKFNGKRVFYPFQS